MSRRKNNPEAARAAILDAATDLFAAQGFRATTINAIANHAGVTKSLIHHHFGNKTDLWDSICRSMLDTYFQAQRALLMNRETDKEVMRESLRLYFNYFRANPRLPRLMAWMRLEMSEAFEDRSEGLMEFGIERVRKAQEQGVFSKDFNPYFIMVGFFFLVEPWFERRDDMRKRFDPGMTDDEMDEAWLETATRMLLSGVSSAPKPTPESTG